MKGSKDSDYSLV